MLFFIFCFGAHIWQTWKFIYIHLHIYTFKFKAPALLNPMLKLLKIGKMARIYIYIYNLYKRNQGKCEITPIGNFCCFYELRHFETKSISFLNLQLQIFTRKTIMHSVAWQTSEVPFYYNSQYSVIQIQLLKASSSQDHYVLKQSHWDVCLQLHKPITIMFTL